MLVIQYGLGMKNQLFFYKFDFSIEKFDKDNNKVLVVVYIGKFLLCVKLYY